MVRHVDESCMHKYMSIRITPLLRYRRRQIFSELALRLPYHNVSPLAVVKLTRDACS